MLYPDSSDEYKIRRAMLHNGKWQMNNHEHESIRQHQTNDEQ